MSVGLLQGVCVWGGLTHMCCRNLMGVTSSPYCFQPQGLSQICGDERSHGVVWLLMPVGRLQISCSRFSLYSTFVFSLAAH